MTVTTCIECGVTILGERLRCPSCHQGHARAISETEVVEEEEPSFLEKGIFHALLAWVVGFEILMLFVLAAVFWVQGC